MGNFNLIEIFSIIVIHFVADFVMQDERWALNKSKNWNALLKHTYTYSVVWFAIGVIYISCKSNMFNDMTWYSDGSLTLFVLITFVCHTITDYFTSKIVGKRFKDEAVFTISMNQSYQLGSVIKPYSNNNEYIIVNQVASPSMGTFSYPYEVKKYNPIPNLGAFTRIGFDQLLHYIQLFLTYYFLIK